MTCLLDAADPEDVKRAAGMLRAGRLVAFPTETVYGLGANAFSEPAVAGIFRAKKRPDWDPLIVHVPSTAALEQVTDLTAARRDRVLPLAAAFWPGPLTLLLPRSANVPHLVTAGRELVGVRVPAHPVAQALLQAAGVPVAAPSANLFGHVSPTTAAHVLADLDGRIDAVLDGGACTVGVESTVLDPLLEPMVLYRQGAVTAEALRAVTGREVAVFRSEIAQPEAVAPSALPSPGVGMRHYAPRAKLILVEGSPAAVWTRALAASQGDRTGVLWPADWPMPETSGALLLAPWGKWDDPASRAALLFAALRALDDRGVRFIVCPLPAAGGLDDAIRDRLEKAARAV